MTTQEYKIHIGIDVSKAALDIFISADRSHHQYENSMAGIKKLVTQLKKYPKAQMLVAMEATGGYEKLAGRTLIKNNFIVSIVNPRNIRAFAKASGKLAKTDKIDVKIIATYLEKMEPKSRLALNENHDKIAELSVRRTQLLTMIVAEKNRLDKVSKEIKRSILRIIKLLEKELAEI